MNRLRLPIDAVLPQVCEALRAGPRALLVAPPGAGKTTRVAPALLDEPWCGGNVLLLPALLLELPGTAPPSFTPGELGCFPAHGANVSSL